MSTEKTRICFEAPAAFGRAIVAPSASTVCRLYVNSEQNDHRKDAQMFRGTSRFRARSKYISCVNDVQIKCEQGDHRKTRIWFEAPAVFGRAAVTLPALTVCRSYVSDVCHR